MPQTTSERARMEDCCSSDLGAMIVEDTVVCGKDFPILCGFSEPIGPGNTASFLQTSSANYPYPSLTPSQPVALAYPALQLFYLLPGNQQGSPPALVPVYSSFPHGQPLYLPALTCGAAQQTDLKATDPLQNNLSEGRMAKEESCIESLVRSEKSRGGFFRPWENVTTLSRTNLNRAKFPKFRPWEEVSSPTLIHKDAEEDKHVMDMMKGMVIGQ